jgi:hypothetical protein
MDRVLHRLGRRLTGEHDVTVEPARVSNREHVVRVELTRGETSVPALVVVRIDGVQSDVKGDALRHGLTSMSRGTHCLVGTQSDAGSCGRLM